MNDHSPVSPQPIPFIDLATQRRRLGTRVDEAILRVLDHGQFIMGPEVRELESELARFCGARHAVSCGNGTDALALVLMAKELKPGQAVFCPAFTMAATAEVVAWFGATPLFVDVEETSFNIDPRSLELGIARATQLGLKPVGVIPVDLYGQPADYDALAPLCETHGLWMLCDAAQSFGAAYKGRKVGSIGLATGVSFYPSKPLACYGDGGAILTDDGELAGVLRSLRIHGHGAHAYDHVRIGMNGRMDTLQAAVLIEKLRIFPDELARRNEVAARYSAALADVVKVPRVAPGCDSAWAQYTIRVPAGKRENFIAELKARGIPTAIHYPKPLHHQPAYEHFPSAGNGLPVSEMLAQEVVSLPMHPYLEAEVQERIFEAVREAIGRV
jgi:dTDP-4-amino-4,6-dideoxygalactose transaminase